MPELPEVETIRRSLDSLVVGRHISRIELLRKDYLQTGKEWIPFIRGCQIEKAQRRGKFIILHLSCGAVLIHHLGMSGRLLFVPSEMPVESHVHVRIYVDGERYELRQQDPRRFGLFAILDQEKLEDYPSWPNLGIDPFLLKPDNFFSLLRGRKRSIKSFLLDQHFVAGLGNIYADESLYRAGIHPLRPAGEISKNESRLLLREIRKILKKAIRSGGTSANDYRKLDGTLGDFQNLLKVYGKQRTPCKRCGRLIERMIIAGRSAHYCPSCQQ